MCDSQGHYSVFGWRFPGDGAHASQPLRSSGLGVCVSSEEASVRTLFPQRTNRSGVWQTTATFFFFFCNCIFLDRPLLFQQSAFDLLGAASELPRAGRERRRACSAGPPGPRGRVAGPQARPFRSSAPISSARPPMSFSNQPRSEGGSGSFENPLTPGVTPLREAASPGPTLYSRKPEAVPRLKAKDAFTSRAPASNWPFVH